MIVRWVAALVAFLVVAYVGVTVVGNFNDATAAGNSWALIAAIGLVVGFAAYAVVEYLQTGAFRSISRQFDTRTIVLMPLAIAFNIILGQAVGAALKIPIYLDSIGTILVGALAGPIPGALTGFLSNILWTYVVPPPFHSDIAGAFAVVAAVIGILAGLFARVGWLRPRPNRPMGQLFAGGVVALVIVGFMAYYAFTRFYVDAFALFNPENTNLLFTILGWAIVLLFVAFVIGFVALLFVRRDLTVAYVVVAGVITGGLAALISAPISANLFSGVTGAGTDFLVAAFRQAGSDIQAATLQQGLLSDPVDKMVTFFTVYLILNAMARRTTARFPQGERLVDTDESDLDDDLDTPPPPTPQGAPV
jgi:energy-coupling factor transport system substrate-specific component